MCDCDFTYYFSVFSKFSAMSFLNVQLCIFTYSSLFHFFYFICSAPITFSLCFPISPSLFFFFFRMFFLKPLSSIIEKLIYILYIYIYNIYFRELMNFHLKIYDVLISLV